MTFNLRYDNPSDGENNWHLRKQEIVSFFNFYEPDIFGIQEGLVHQVGYLEENLPQYSKIGVGRDDGKMKGEFAAIFYNSEKVALIETATYWLSETPLKVSVGWDASMERITTFGTFKMKNTGDTLYVFNCHFDHIGQLARKQSAELLIQLINQKGLSDKKVIIMGDFNAEPSEEPIQVLGSYLFDAREITNVAPYGPEGTFNSFDNHQLPNKRIDYLFVKNLKVERYRCIEDKRINGLWLSDHLPVMIQTEL
ncbi:MAG: endonuclease/exonuclease/phosphatase family protein [Crocinitomicaceae bacterium]